MQSELPYTWRDSNYNVDDIYDSFVLANANTGNRIVTLPATNKMKVGRVFYIVRQDANPSFTVTIQPASGDTINGASSIVIGSQSLYQAYMIIHGGTNDWVAIKIS